METVIENLANKVIDRLDQGSVSAEVKLEVNDLLSHIAGDLSRIGDNDAYEDALLRYIEREHDKFTADTVDDLPAGFDEVRADSNLLCGCENAYCKLKRGQLPPDLLLVDSIDAGIREFRKDHNGTPYVLLEAREDWTATKQRVMRALGLMDIALSNNQSLTDLDVDIEHPALRDAIADAARDTDTGGDDAGAAPADD